MPFILCVLVYSLTFGLSFNGPVLKYSQPASTVQKIQNSTDESEIRALTDAFYRSWAAKDLDGFSHLWSASSSEAESRKKSAQELFGVAEKIELRSLTIRAVKLEGGKARVRVETDARVIEAGTGNERKGFGKMFRTLECVKDAAGWKIMRETSTYDEIAAALASVASDQERATMLEIEPATVEMARALINQANRFHSQRNYSLSMSFNRLGQSVAEKIGAGLETARAYHNIGNLHLLQGDYAKALESYQQGLAKYSAIDDKSGVASMLNNIGNVYLQRSDYAVALDYFQKSLAIRESLDNQAGLANALNNIGIVHDAQGDYAQALDYYQRSLKICEANKDEPGIVRALHNLGFVNYHMGDYAQALEYYQKSMALSDSLGDKGGIPGHLLNIGLVHDAQGAHSQALDYYHKALAMFESSKSQGGIGKALNNIGSVHFDMGDYSKALDYYQKSLALRESIKDLEGVASATLNIGLVRFKQEQYAQALERFQKSLEMYEGIGKKAPIANALKSIAKVYIAQENYPGALEYAQRSATVARSIGASEMLWDALVTVNKAYRRLNKPVEARKALEEAIAVIEALRDHVSGGEQAQQRFFQSKVNPYHGMVELLTLEGSPSEALIFAERAKARVLLDVLKSGRVNSDKAMTGREQEQERKLRTELFSINAQITRASQQDERDQVKLDELKVRREKARLDYETFQSTLYAAHPELRVGRGDAQVIKAEELATLAPDERSALLEFVVTDDSTYLFTITRADGVQVYNLPIKKDELSKQTEGFRRQLAGRDLGFRTSARKLYQLLLKPAESQLQGKTSLIIAPDNQLWDLPFQALLSQDGRYLLQKSAITYVPSLTVLREMNALRYRRRTKSDGAALLALGNPALGKRTVERAALTLRDEKLTPLPEAEQEVKSLRRLYGTTRSKVYIGDEAREDRVKVEAGQARILHFATHGMMNNASPMYSHLVLAQGGENEDGLLEAWELMQLNLKAELAVLSACETARGSFGAGEGMIGLSWAMFVAGVPATLVSQWKVESASTRELMLGFHQNLRAPSRKSVTKAEALRQAALKLMKNPQTNHPFYWAGFVLVGAGQ